MLLHIVVVLVIGENKAFSSPKISNHHFRVHYFGLPIDQLELGQVSEYLRLRNSKIHTRPVTLMRYCFTDGNRYNFYDCNIR